MLVIDEVVKRFGTLTVLDRVSMLVPTGAVIGLIGPNGSGKSTLFDVITGLERTDGGHVLLDDAPITGLSAAAIARRGLVRTFQVPRVARQMTLMENLMVAPSGGVGESLVRLFSLFQARRVKADELQRRERAWEVLDHLGLERLGNEYAGTLSGGQLKLLAIGITQMLGPGTLLLDEPTAGVNPTVIERILDFIGDRRGRGLTTIIIEHNIGVIARICDAVYVLDAGQIIAHGSPAAIQSDDRVVAAYLGRRAAGHPRLRT